MILVLKIAFLWALFSIGTIMLANATTGNTALAVYSTTLLGDQVSNFVQYGRFSLFIATLNAAISKGIPFIIFGGILGLAGRVIVKKILAKSKSVSEGNSVIQDSFGGRLIMVNNSFHHKAPGPRYKITQMDISAEGITQFEHDALGVIASYGDIPADTIGAHQTSLLEHTVNVWKEAIKQFGVGSLESMLAVSHDIGKILAYKKDSNGQWIRVSNKHQQQSLIVVRNLPGFMQLDEPVRRDLIQSLTCLQTGWVPKNLADRLKAAVKSAKFFDMKSGVNESKAADEKMVGVDLALLSELIKENLPSILDEMNINRSLNASDYVEGIYQKSNKVIFISGKSMRKNLAKCLPEEIVKTLRLKVATTGIHPSHEIILNALKSIGDLVFAINDVRSENGVYRIRSGSLRLNGMIALSDGMASDELKTRWGIWKYEVDVLASKGDVNDV